jgi:hypothetical protein
VCSLSMIKECYISLRQVNINILYKYSFHNVHFVLFKTTIITSKFENGSSDTNMRSYNKSENFELKILYIRDAQKWQNLTGFEASNLYCSLL